MIIKTTDQIEVELVVDVSDGEKATHDYPGSEPVAEIHEAYVVFKNGDKEVRIHLPAELSEAMEREEYFQTMCCQEAAEQYEALKDDAADRKREDY